MLSTSVRPNSGGPAGEQPPTARARTNTHVAAKENSRIDPPRRRWSNSSTRRLIIAPDERAPDSRPNERSEVSKAAEPLRARSRRLHALSSLCPREPRTSEAKFGYWGRDLGRSREAGGFTRAALKARPREPR